MAKFYGKRIIANKMTLEDVPERWREATEKWLKENAE